MQLHLKIIIMVTLISFHEHDIMSVIGMKHKETNQHQSNDDKEQKTDCSK